MFVKSSVLAFIVASSALFAYAGPCVRQYTVQPGDICDDISAMRNVSTYQLATINAGYINPECTNLVPGSTICIGYQNEDCTTTYVVQPNDDCELVTAAYNINTTMLWNNNPQLDATCSNMYIGEVLCVAGTAIHPPPSSGGVNSAIPSTALPATSSDLPWCS